MCWVWPWAMMVYPLGFSCISCLLVVIIPLVWCFPFFIVVWGGWPQMWGCFIVVVMSNMLSCWVVWVVYCWLYWSW